ncbi:ParB/RepB/Spo0J family partition protein [Candidatus Cyrtobacter comes]|uniref:Probable chromosome-partitioning protein ParB n=1 Tax=Candidatus Cyrtobacter comes TaxID=675776 RepID=A0ABU5L9H0_9RICK|nr:ParB/RepB/Spo0J family partition protein [Candidatus Cyrtobacter comes]MDZ5762764.1 ParB/RepB/Spo0J family partition protein [Candidatus Cyrtobacter comes]
MKKNSKVDFGDIFKTNISIDQKDIVNLDVSRCSIWKYADRQEFELGNLDELAKDILENGQIQPIVVRRSGVGYEVIAGQRRLRACALIKTEVRAVIIDVCDAEAFFIQNSENIKKDISVYSKSRSYFMIMNDEKVSQKELCDKLGIAKSTLNEILVFNHIPQVLWDKVGDMSKISIRTAKYIKKLLEEDADNLNKLLDLSKEIKSGVGVRYIKGRVFDEKDDDVYFCNNNGERVIKIIGDRLMVMKPFRKEVDLVRIAEDSLSLKRESKKVRISELSKAQI